MPTNFFPTAWPSSLTGTNVSTTTYYTGTINVSNGSNNWISVQLPVGHYSLDKPEDKVYLNQDGIETLKPGTDTMPTNMPLTNKNAAGLTRPTGRSTIHKLKNNRGEATLKVTHEVAYNILNFNNWNRVALSIDKLKQSLSVLKEAHVEDEFFKGTTAFDRPYFLLSDHLKKRRTQFKDLSESICKKITHYEYVERVKKYNKNIIIRKQLLAKEDQKTFFSSLKKETQKQIKEMRRLARESANIKMVKSIFRPQYVAPNGRIGADLYYQGGLYTGAKENRFYDMQSIKHIQLCFQDKRPQNMDRHFGIEIEFIAAGNAQVVAKELAKNNLARYCLIKGDGSIRPNDTRPYGHELNICVPISIAKPIIEKICEVLKNPTINGDINTTCGLHVHLDMRQPTENASAELAEKSFKNLIAAQMMLRDMQPDSRKDNTYCAITPNYSFRDAIRSGRYFIVNGSAFNVHKTIEIRVSSASLNPVKINNWAIFLGKIAYNYAPKNNNGIMPTTLQEWAADCSMSEGLVNWAAKRLKKHTPQSPFLKNI